MLVASSTLTWALAVVSCVLSGVLIVERVHRDSILPAFTTTTTTAPHSITPTSTPGPEVQSVPFCSNLVIFSTFILGVNFGWCSGGLIFCLINRNKKYKKIVPLAHLKAPNPDTIEEDSISVSSITSNRLGIEGIHPLGIYTPKSRRK